MYKGTRGLQTLKSLSLLAWHSSTLPSIFARPTIHVLHKDKFLWLFESSYAVFSHALMLCIWKLSSTFWDCSSFCLQHWISCCLTDIFSYSIQQNANNVYNRSSTYFVFSEMELTGQLRWKIGGAFFNLIQCEDYQCIRVVHKGFWFSSFPYPERSLASYQINFQVARHILALEHSVYRLD